MRLRDRLIRIGLMGEWSIGQEPAGWRPGRSGLVFIVEAPTSASDEECARLAYQAWREDLGAARTNGWRIPWHTDSDLAA